jgi:hypothetical protein
LWDGGGLQNEGQRGAQGLFSFLLLFIFSQKEGQRGAQGNGGPKHKKNNHFSIPSIVGPQRSSESRTKGAHGSCGVKNSKIQIKQC